ncbi:MAG: endonuclease MutS2 [Candidatus Kapaibacterium sp.]
MQEYEPNREEIELIEETLDELEYHQVLEHVRRNCYSELGYERILESRPMDDLYWLRREHDLIAEMVHLMTSDDPVPFEGLTDVRTQLQKSLVEKAVLAPTELLAVRDVVRLSRVMKQYFANREEKTPALAEETSALHNNRLLEKHIDEAIDDEGTVRDSATRELQRIRRSIFEKSNRLRDRLKKILRRVVEEDMVQEDFYTLREERFVLPVKSEHKRHIPGIIHGMSQTGQTVFLEPSEIIEMNNEISLLMNEEKREVHKILSQLTDELGHEARQFLSSLDIIGHIDAISAKAKYALKMGGVKPEIWDNNEIYLKDIRHPLLVHAKGAKNVLPLSIEFGNSTGGYLISGPNAGGKTVALKSIGLNIALALSGIFPLGECRTNFRMIFSSIGDHQSIENDLSTFSSQIIKMRKIVASLSDISLILIDEIGSGTDPQEGAALASGILDTFIKMRSFFVATTHQSSLKTYALNRDEVENASLEFDEKNLKPTYTFLPKIPGNSYAFVLAENLGLSKMVLQRAEKYLGTREKELEESISVLQKYISEAESERETARTERRKALKMKEQYDQRMNEIREKKDEIVKKARLDAEKIVRDANKLIENTIREIQEEKRSFAEIKEEYARHKSDIEERARQITKEEKAEKAPAAINEGDKVRLEDSPSVGTVISIDEKNETAEVDFNGFKFRLPFAQLEKTEKAPQKASQTKPSDFTKLDARSRIDVRGMRAHEAIAIVEEFVYDALTTNISPLTIIHGKGTGALRKAIQEFLSQHPSVEKYRSGELVEGGDGVTIVEL